MIDTLTIKEHINVLALIGQSTQLKKIATTRGGEYAGPCPFCGGIDRFHVQPETGQWMCRYCSDGWKDVISFVMKRDNVDFQEAAAKLSGNLTDTRTVRAGAFTPPTDQNNEPPSANWQVQARQIAEQARLNLWQPAAAKALDWLHQRGLNDDTLKYYRIGYWPQDEHLDPAPFGLDRVWIDRGVVIPGWVGDELWYVKVRRPVAPGVKPKYRSLTGSRTVALFGANDIVEHPNQLMLLTEGEFDAMLANQIVGDAVACLTLGSCSNWNARWNEYLIPAAALLVCYDGDEDGQKGLHKMIGRTLNAVDATLPAMQPGDKDLSDFIAHGGDLWAHIRGLIDANNIIKSLRLPKEGGPWPLEVDDAAFGSLKLMGELVEIS